jgi:hypothetical protein
VTSIPQGTANIGKPFGSNVRADLNANGELPHTFRDQVVRSLLHVTRSELQMGRFRQSGTNVWKAGKGAETIGQTSPDSILPHASDQAPVRARP